MAYEPTVWQDGDVITAQKMNKLENAVSGATGIFYVQATWDDNNDEYVLPVSCKDFYDATRNGQMPVIVCQNDGGEIFFYYILRIDPSTYQVDCIYLNNGYYEQTYFSASSLTGNLAGGLSIMV